MDWWVMAIIVATFYILLFCLSLLLLYPFLMWKASKKEILESGSNYGFSNFKLFKKHFENYTWCYNSNKTIYVPHERAIITLDNSICSVIFNGGVMFFPSFIEFYKVWVYISKKMGKIIGEHDKKEEKAKKEEKQQQREEKALNLIKQHNRNIIKW